MQNWKFALSSADSAPASAPILLQGTIAENLQKAAALGYQGLEVHIREDAALDYGDIRRTMESCGAALSAVITGRLCTQGGCTLTDDRPYVTDAAMRGMSRYIEMAAQLDTDLVVGWIKGKIPDGANPAPYLERLARNLNDVCKEAEGCGVKVFVEVINRYETNIFTTAAETVAFLDRWQIPNCYVHLDTFHMGIDEVDPIAAIRACKGRLGYFHVADNSRCEPGRGTFDFGSYLQALDEIGYDGFISVECLPGANGEETARKGIAHMKRCAL